MTLGCCPTGNSHIVTDPRGHEIRVPATAHSPQMYQQGSHTGTRGHLVITKRGSLWEEVTGHMTLGSRRQGVQRTIPFARP